MQERAARATPAAVEDHRHGCWLRYSDSGFTWWAGAALMHGPTDAETLTDRIAAAVEFYAAHDAPPTFQVCPACPADLDPALARRGYQQAGAMSLHTAETASVARRLATPPLLVTSDEHPGRAWFRLWLTVQGLDCDAHAEWRLLRRVDRPSTYVTAYSAGQPVAVGRAVADTGWVGVFGMATLPDARGQGAGRAVLAALTDWASQRGVPHLYLQVERDNDAALRLYRGAGFEQVATYHYRIGNPP